MGSVQKAEILRARDQQFERELDLITEFFKLITQSKRKDYLLIEDMSYNGLNILKGVETIRL